MNDDNQNVRTNECSVNIINRKSARITGVTEVESFDETQVVLATRCGELTVDGNDMHIGNLDTEKEIIMLSGNISSAVFSEEKPLKKRKLFGIYE